jgi:hypothetical protein
MSESVDSTGDRDLEAEAAATEAGHVGIPFDALCVSCGQTRIKRADQDADDLTSFKHYCDECQTATWWNPTRSLPELDGDAP